MVTVTVCETFVSVQGESTWAGLPCFFIRLAGCNLRCRYCDTTYAYEGGRPVGIGDLVAEAEGSGALLIEITGGEPLLQKECAALARALAALPGRTVLVETNGSMDISRLPEGASAIVDVKCPGSGESASFDVANVGRLRSRDEVKFVIGDRYDYEWAKALATAWRLPEKCHAVLFSAVHGVLEGGTLAEWVARDRLPVRVQVQLHRVLGMR